MSGNARHQHSGIHKNRRVARAGGFEPSFSPATSPQLNPIARVWKFTRRRCLDNRYVCTVDSITEAMESTFDEWRAPMRQLGSYSE